MRPPCPKICASELHGNSRCAGAFYHYIQVRVRSPALLLPHTLAGTSPPRSSRPNPPPAARIDGWPPHPPVQERHLVRYQAAAPLLAVGLGGFWLAHGGQD